VPHIHEKYDFTITVFIVYNGKVLLVNHPRYDKWLPPGGHVELDEDPEMTLFREIEEETGLQVEVLSGKPNFDSPGTKALLTPSYVDVHEANPPHKHISLIYFARAVDNVFRLSKEHTDMRWLAEEQLAEPDYKLSPAIIFYATEALRAAATR